ncbi:MAG: metal-sensing transcriptional repressor [Armatimonadetes bacterium]|nr:metal-sensing transcriptional repressor [Armatimonadota bacterium]
MCPSNAGHAHERIREQVIRRLSRAEGHLRAVSRMWEEGKTCPEVLLQISAVQAALRRIGRIIVEEHLETCLAEAARQGSYDAALAELREALRQLL